MKPLSIGQILDRSFQITCRIFVGLFLKLIGPLALLTSLAYIPPLGSPEGPNILAIMLVGLVGWVVYIWITLIASDHWQNNPHFKLRSFSWRVAPRLLMISLMIGLGFCAGPMLGGIVGGLLSAVLLGRNADGFLYFAIIAFFVLIGLIPAIIFYVNRILAPVIAVIEGSTSFEALVASKQLMSSTSRFRLGSPFARLTLLSLASWVAHLLSGIFSGFVPQLLPESPTSGWSLSPPATAGIRSAILSQQLRPSPGWQMLPAHSLS